MVELIFDKSVSGRIGTSFSKPFSEEKAEKFLPSTLLRQNLDLPEVSEIDVVRHYTGLSRKNYGVDSGFYPLGSCTMKYNPKVNEEMAKLPGFAGIHPLQPQDTVQGALQLMFELEKFLCEICGFERFTLQPPAGACGEFTGIRIIKAYFESSGDKRNRILIPDSSHGTNPASVTQCGFISEELKSNSNGLIDLDLLRQKMTEEIAGIMITNPNTLGLFERDIVEICNIVHGKGGLVYMDGANMNAMLGVCRPGDLGIDVMHLNLHKSFSTPHGGGGPGSGPVGVKKHLVKFLPKPMVEKDADGGKYYLDYNLPDSIGKVKSFYGNFGMLVRAYTYIKGLGAEGIRAVGENAVLNANYMKEKLKKYYKLPFDRICLHEFVLSDEGMPNGITTMDIAKRLLDYGFHAPTIYFPMIVHGAIMIEPTETESRQTMDEFIIAMIEIRKEAEESPDLVKNAPHSTIVKRLDAVKAAREPIIRWKKQ